MNTVPYYHVDVFSSIPFAGNGLIVFTETAGFTTGSMQLITQEMRQFETVFLQKINDTSVRARIFTCEEELDFAGHPILGAAATLHDLHRRTENKVEWTFELNKKTVKVMTEKKGQWYEAVMNQGAVEFGKVLNETETRSVLEYLGASREDLYPGLYPTVVSTGLPYLIVPFLNNFFQARIGAPGLDKQLHRFGAQFIGLLDIEARSIRTGSNDGSVEDIATGSLVGPACAFLVRHGIVQPNSVIRFDQGRNLRRNSELYVELRTRRDNSMDVFVSGSVCKIASGALEFSNLFFTNSYGLFTLEF
jgi:trans-2,3-dihydro-3-hydroxyanthranilate isomerase